MEYSTPTVERISRNFEKHNPYAQQMLQIRERDESELDVVMVAWAIMAVAYELSQIRFQITRGVENGG